MTLFFVNADAWDGSPHGNDLWVVADSPSQAVRYWQSYFGTTEEPLTVDEVPARTTRGPIPWDEVAQVWVNTQHRKL